MGLKSALMELKPRTWSCKCGWKSAQTQANISQQIAFEIHELGHKLDKILDKMNK